MKVTIVQQVVPHYRVAFFRKLHQRLSANNISMRLLYGTAARGVADSGQILNDEWATHVNTQKLKFLNVNVVWQSAMPLLSDSDLVIVEQSNRLLINYRLLLRRFRSGLKLAYWGHGRNMQSHHPYGPRELLKRALLLRVDWWFAYTTITRDYLLSKGYPAKRITIVNNAVEQQLWEHLRKLSLRSRAEVARELGLSSMNIGLFCGGLYKQKRIEFLLDAAKRIRESVADFELLVVGEGPDRSLIEEAMKQHSWIHYAGPVIGEAVARYWYVSKVLLMPGLVGLAVVDSFNAACPIVTTSYPYHSPEIAYLQSGVNGIQTADNPDYFAQAVIGLLKDDKKIQLLREGCMASAAYYTLDNMVENFANGIETCLSMAKQDEKKLTLQSS